MMNDEALLSLEEPPVRMHLKRVFWRMGSPSANFIWPTRSRSKKIAPSPYQQVNFLGPEELGIGQAKISWYFPVFRIYS